MSEQQPPYMTPVDALISDDTLQILKACIPFLGIQEQSAFLTFTKFMEFRRSIHLTRQETDRLKACSIEPAMRTPVHMLNQIRTYCSDAQKHSIDNVLNSLQLFEMLQLIQTQSNEMSTEEYLKSMMSDQQKQMFQEFSNTVQQASRSQEDSYGES